MAANPVAYDDSSYYTNVNTDLVVTALSSPAHLLANDLDIDSTITASVVTNPTSGSLIAFGSNGTFTYRPNAGFRGIVNFTYKINDGSLDSNVAKVTIAVGQRLLAKQNLDANVLAPFSSNTIDSNRYASLLSSSASSGSVASGTGGDGSFADITTGDLIFAESVTPTETLVYRGDSLTKPIITVETQLAPGFSIPSAISARLIFNGVAGTSFSYNTSGLASQQAMRFSIQADGSALATGMYDYTLNITTTIGGLTSTQAFTGKQSIVNRSGSEYGSGWWLDGLDRMVDSSSGALLVRGNGNVLWFAKTGLTYSRAAGDTDMNTLVKTGNNTYTLTSKTGIVSNFSTTGLLTSIVDTNSNTTSFAYADRNSDGIASELISITDPFSRVTNINYTSGKVSSIAHYSGRTTTLAVASGNLASYTLTDPDGAGALAAPVFAFGYTSGRLTSSTDAVSNVTSYSYSTTDGRLRMITRPDTKTWQLVPIETIALPTGASGNTIRLPINSQASITDERGSIWRMRTDRFGLMTELITALGFVTTVRRDWNGLPVVVVKPDPDGPGPLSSSVTAMGYNSLSSLTHLIAPDGGVTTTTYSAALSRMLSNTDPIGRTTYATYNSTGNMLTQVDGAGFVTTYTYNTRGLPTSMRLPDPDGLGPLGASLYSFGYDSFFRMNVVSNPDSSFRSYVFNSADQLLADTDELGKTTWFSYDSLGRQIATTNRIGVATYWGYDSLSRPIVFTDGLLNLTNIEYNNRGWIRKVIYPDPDGSAGPLNRAEDVRVYDSVGNLTSRKDPRGNFQGTLSYQYDIDSRQTFSGNDLYGALGERYKYDNRGLLTEVERVRPDADPSSTPPSSNPFTKIYENQYDSLGRLVLRLTFDFNSSNPLFREIFQYNKAGELVKRIDGADASGNGNETTNVYDGRGLIVQKTQPDPDGNGPMFPLVEWFAYDNMGRPVLSDRGYGRVIRLEYNSRSWVTKVIEADPDGTGPATSPTTSIGYNLRGDNVHKIDPLGRVSYVGYDHEQRVSETVEPDPDGTGPLLNSYTYYTYNANNWLTRIQDPVGAITDFTYDNLGRKNSTIEADPDVAGPLTSPVTSYTYNAIGLSSTTDPLSRTTQYVRDTRGRVTKMTDALGNATDYTYNYYDSLRTRTEADPDGAGPELAPKYEWFYDTMNRTKSERDPKLKSTTYQYDAKSQLEFLTDRNGNTTQFKYDSLNRLIEEKNANSASRTYTYNVAGNLARVVDRNRNVTQYTYDSLDRATTEQWFNYSTSQGNLALPSTTVATTQEGTKTGQQDAVGWATNGNTTGISGTFTLSYNGSTTGPIPWNAASATVQNAFQALPTVGGGNASIVVSTPSGFGAFGRHVQVTFQGALIGQNLPRVTISTTGLTRVGLGSTITPVQQQFVTAPQSRNEKQVISVGGLSTGVWQIAYGTQVSGPLSYNISSTDLKTVLDGFIAIDNVSVIVANNAGLRQFYIEFAGTQAGINMAPLQVDTSNLSGGNLVRTITTNYNASDEILSVIDPSSTVSFARDGMGRATTVATTIATLSQSVNLNQTFDSTSNRTELRATVGSTADFKNTYNYDRLRRLIDIVQTGQSGGNSVVSKHITQQFNAASQRTNVTRYQSSGTSNLVASSNFTFDTIGRLQGIAHSQGATNLNTYSFGYDPISRLKTLTSTAEGTTNYTYYENSELKSATGTQPSESYNYDFNGNRNTTGYTVTSDNRTTSDPNFNYQYDAEGNLTRKTNKSTLQVVATYEWDHRNRLTKVNGGVTGPGGIEYEYDAFNRLVRRRAFDPNVPNKYWVYDEGINPVLQFDTGGNAGVGGISHRYIWSDYVDDLLSDEQISFPSNTVNTLWPLADHLGSIRDIADFNEATGITAIANHRTYDSFGKLVDETGTASIPFGYTGKLVDKTTGLQNNLNRWYDPNLGKWISQDPIGFAGGDANLYRYVGNSPTMYIDPSGLTRENTPNWHHLVPQQFRNVFGNSIDEAWNGHFLRAGDHNALHSAGWNKDWNKWIEDFRTLNGRSPNLADAKGFMNELKGSEKYRDILARGFRAGWSHSEWLDKSGKVKQKLGALLARKMAKITGKTVAKKTGKGVLASIPGISLVISAIDYPARASEFGTGTAIGMSIFDNIPIVDISLAITEGIDSVQQERIKASREGAIEEQAAIDDFMREAEQAGMDYE